MTNAWLNDFERTNKNALSADWFVSPLEYSWPDGKQLFDRLFSTVSSPSSQFDELFSPQIYKTSMQVDFRAEMMVVAFMRQNFSKSYGLEIENGLMHLYRLDFASCISQWIYVIEGYCRQLFSVESIQNVKPNSWTIPASGSADHNSFVQSLSTCLSEYLKRVLFKGTKDFNTDRLSRNLLLHGNVQNKSFFSQKNCLLLMYLLDTLVFIEMAANEQFPQMFSEHEGESERIERRKYIYAKLGENAFHDDSLLRIEILKEHL